MWFLSTILLAASAIAVAIPGAHVPPVKRSVSTSKAVRSTSASPLTVSSHVLSLTKTTDKGYNPRSAAYVLGLTPRSRIATSSHSSSLLSLFEGEEYATSIMFGTETFEVIVDTGSSDTWLAEKNFQCINVTTGADLPESACAFGPTYSVTDTFKQIPNENFNITYGDGEFLSGIVGTEKVTLAGITVKQEVALVNLAAWEGDGTTSGLTGLAYPALTSAYPGTDPHDDNYTTPDIYSPIFTTMYTEGKVAPLFSLAILRDISGPAGYLALGGLPPINFVQNFATTPILVTSITGYPDTYDFYTINVDNIYLYNFPLFGSGRDRYEYIVDSGTTLNYFPTPVADAINFAFDPPAFYSEDEGAYIVSCTARAPKVAVEIGGVTLATNPLDLILLAGTDENGDDVCISGVSDGGVGSDTVYILGDTFQKNVVTVFDVGAGEMKFAEREYYPSNDPVKI